MNDTTSAIIFALIAMFGFGLGNSITKRYANNLGPVRLLIYRGLFNVLFLGIILLFSLKETTLELESIAFGSVFVSLSYFGLMFFNKAADKGKIGIVVPVVASRTIFAVAVGVMFLDDSLSIGQLIAILVIVLGVMLLSVNFKALKSSNLLSWKSGVPFAILAAFFWGTTLPFFGRYADVTGVAFFTFLTELIVFIQGTIQTKLIGQKISITKEEIKTNIGGILVISVTSVIAGLAATAGYATGEVNIVSAITGASPLVAVVFSKLIYKEILRPIQYAAGLMIVAAVVAISVV